MKEITDSKDIDMALRQIRRAMQLCDNILYWGNCECEIEIPDIGQNLFIIKGESKHSDLSSFGIYFSLDDVEKLTLSDNCIHFYFKKEFYFSNYSMSIKEFVVYTCVIEKFNIEAVLIDSLNF